jgi:hypothetical protein
VDWLRHFNGLGVRDIIVLDTEFITRTDVGKCVVPVFLGAISLVTGKEWRVRLLPLKVIPCPLPMGDDVLYVGFSLTAEWSVFKAMGWALPSKSIDLYAEAMMATSHLDGEGNVKTNKRKRKPKNKKKAAEEEQQVRPEPIAVS